MNNESSRINFIHTFGTPIVPKHIDFDKLIEQAMHEVFDSIEHAQDLVDPEWLSENENKQAFLDAGYDWQYIV